MPKNVQVGKSRKNNWRNYQSQILAESKTANSDYRNWFHAISEGFTAENQLYFINSTKGSRPGSKPKIEKAVEDVFDKFDGKLTDENAIELYKTHGITVSNYEPKYFFELWTEACDKMVESLIDDAVKNPKPVVEKVKVQRQLLRPQALAMFENDPYPSRKECEKIAEAEGVSARTVRNWLTKYRKHHGLPSRPKKHEMLSRNVQSEEPLNPDLSTDDFKKLEVETIISERESRESRVHALFEENPYPSKGEREELAKIEGVSLKTVNHWLAKYRQQNDIRSPTRGSRSLFDLHPLLDQQYSLNPFPSKEDKIRLMEVTGLSKVQITRSFSVRRKRDGLLT